MAAESESVAVAIPRAREAPARAVDDPIAKLNQICKAIALGVAITAGATALYFHFFNARFNGLVEPSAMDHAQVAMRIAEGKGMTTGVVTPLGLQFAPTVQDHPDLANSPLYPYALAAAFRVRSVSNGTVAAFNGLLYLLTVWAVYGLAKAVYGKPIAILAAVLYGSSAQAMEIGLLGQPVALGGLFLTLTLLALYVVMRREWGSTNPGAIVSEEPAGVAAGVKWLGIVAAALLFALTYLCGHVSLLLLVPLLLMVWFGLRRRKTAAAFLFLVVAVACLAPWFYYNYQRTKTLLPPLQTSQVVTRTKAYPGMSALREVSEAVPAPVSFAIGHPAEIGLKFVNGLIQLYRRLPRGLGIYLFPFFVIGAFWAKGSREARALWRAVIAIIAIQIAAACLSDLTVSATRVLVPVATCLAAGAFVQFVGATVRSRAARGWLTVLLIAAAVFPYAVSVTLAGKELPHPSYPNLAWLRDARYPAGHPEQGQLVVPEDAVIATNVPSAVAWYTGRTALWLPAHKGGLEALQSNGADIDYVYLSRGQVAYPEEAEPDFWMQMLARPDPNQIANLGRAAVLPGGELLIELKKGS